MKLIEEANRFVGYDDENEAIAEITWQTRDGALWVDHTFTHPSLRGQGVAAELLEAVVNKAIDEGLKIMPVCPYVVRKFDQEPSQYESIDARK